MIDDIVTRLRELQHRGMHPEDYRTILIGNAADEIEHLRNELAEANSEYQKLWNKHNAVMRDRKYPLTNDYIGEI